MHTDVWTYPEASQLGTSIDPTVDLSGYEVEATDGSIGKVDEATYETGRSFLVVDTGPWIFGKKVMLPAGVIRSIDTTDERVFVNRTKDQIKDSPEYDDTMLDDESYRSRLGSYYGQGGHGYRDLD
ncbi:MAG TPA: PRC-barrel domain-containing protein [Gaiellaceae bacterium]|nr:PRC-barrel domain-containing protein [Gaiellaceae bacterium]